MSEVLDNDVTAAFGGGQPDALTLIYERFGPLIYSIALRSLGARSDAEDVTQQVFVSAWRSRGSFDRRRGTLGGWLNAGKLSGTIWHKGGILFVNPATGKQIQVSDFVISVHQGVLTAEVNGNPKVRVPLLRLSLAHATIGSGRHYVRISGIVVTLTRAAASALDATFGTTLFKPGLELGTASTLLRF